MIEPFSRLGFKYLKRITELERLSGRQARQIACQAAQLKETRASAQQMRRQLENLPARNEKLEEMLRRKSGNSSQPPSIAGPCVARPKRKRKRSGKRGGRPGHARPGHGTTPPSLCPTS